MASDMTHLILINVFHLDPNKMSNLHVGSIAYCIFNAAAANAEMVPCFASGRKCNFHIRTLCWALLLAIMVGRGSVGGLKFVGNNIQWILLLVCRLDTLFISQERKLGFWIIYNILGTFICLYMLIHLYIYEWDSILELNKSCANYILAHTSHTVFICFLTK